MNRGNSQKLSRNRTDDVTIVPYCAALANDWQVCLVVGDSGKLVKAQQESNRWCYDSSLLCSTCGLLSLSCELPHKIVRLSIDKLELIVKITDLPFCSWASLFALRMLALKIVPSTVIFQTLPCSWLSHLRRMGRRKESSPSIRSWVRLDLNTRPSVLSATS